MPVSVGKRVEERYERESVGGIVEQCVIGDELVFGGYLQIVASRL